MSKDLEVKERDFTAVVDGKEKNFKIKRPNFSVGNKADLIYKKAFSDALLEGLLTTFQMKESLDGIEYYNNSSDTLEQIDVDLAEEIGKLDGFEDEKAVTPTILKIRELRARRMLEVYKVNSMYENTAESYAEGLRNQFYASKLTFDEAGNNVWKSFKDFQECEDSTLGALCVNQVMLLNARIKNNFEMEFPENQWLLKHGIINENGEAIEKEKVEEEVAEVTEEIAEVVEEAEKPKAKAKPKGDAKKLRNSKKKPKAIKEPEAVAVQDGS